MTRIAVLVHSTNPRGGVVHGMQLAEALCDAGHQATLIAPDVGGQGFFREPRCAVLTIPAKPEIDTVTMVSRRIDEIAAFLEQPATGSFDIYHAQDPIGANALAGLVGTRRIQGFVRTVHHLDRFDDPRLAAWQARGMHAASRVCVVSRLWRDRLQHDHGVTATIVGNGVDTARFTPRADPHDAAVRARLGLPVGTGPIVLAMGGIEPRKNTLGTLQAFQLLAGSYPGARLVIAGGATLLDHRPYRERFDTALARSGVADRVIVAGVMPDDQLPALYRIADMLAFPSLEEGFGLCVLEAMACGRPVIVSDIAPFTEYLQPDDVLWAAPDEPGSILMAMLEALDTRIRDRLHETGPGRAAAFGWNGVAMAHLPVYAALDRTLEPNHA
ncbi:MSMEG_0565 family glycosyltransferase [Lichenicola cladoniae]|uniref:MSMEG_0565 family glycosyltransferase n=1 Tax=Lichenicola cladoniae TaxID=1484109 RepID=A0A6M8HN70_9PROT|nr:MSMEG_0565 family glycosyltransferase [Lichenicola cladoniae]NPD67373.1 MSMEG_0565 family glycosyltransferase [Acetobacteraceae bacterium]QKE89869.1 MSMEG_0565 family glycosyltransferase [Lichenicola cladoniae]